MPQNVGSIEDLVTVLNFFHYAALFAELHAHAKRARAEPPSLENLDTYPSKKFW